MEKTTSEEGSYKAVLNRRTAAMVTTKCVVKQIFALLWCCWLGSEAPHGGPRESILQGLPLGSIPVVASPKGQWWERNLVTGIAKSLQDEEDLCTARRFVERSPSPGLIWCLWSLQQSSEVPLSILVSALSSRSCCLERGSGGSSLHMWLLFQSSLISVAVAGFSCGSRGEKDLPKSDLTSLESICWPVFHLPCCSEGWVEIKELLTALLLFQILLCPSPSASKEWKTTDHKKVVSLRGLKNFGFSHNWKKCLASYMLQVICPLHLFPREGYNGDALRWVILGGI